MLGGLPAFTRRAGRLRSFERAAVSISSDVTAGQTLYKNVQGTPLVPLVLTINTPFRLAFLATWLATGSGTVNLSARLTVDGVLLANYTNNLSASPQGFVLVNANTGFLEGESLQLVVSTDTAGYSPGILYNGETYK